LRVCFGIFVDFDIDIKEVFDRVLFKRFFRSISFEADRNEAKLEDVRRSDQEISFEST